jgi:4-aminobutyrate aminotransferase-like enzyme
MTAENMSFYSVMPILLEMEIAGPRSREVIPRREIATSPGAVRLAPIAVERAGLYSNCVRFLPALGISDAEIDEAMDAVADAVAVRGVSS